MTTPASAPEQTTDVRATVLEVMRTVLERDLDPTVDVFDQGATSLAFVRALAQINDRFGITVDVGELEEASIDEVAVLVARQLADRGSAT